MQIATYATDDTNDIFGSTDNEVHEKLALLSSYYGGFVQFFLQANLSSPLYSSALYFHPEKARQTLSVNAKKDIAPSFF